MNKVNGNKYTFINFIYTDEGEKNMILSWRNDLSIRKWMYDKEPISLKNHLNFLESLKFRKDRLYFLVKRNDENIGVFSLVDINNFEGEWGYYLAPTMHNRNLGVEFYYATLKYCFESIQIKKVKGFALDENRNANSLNSLFGFEKLEINKEFADGVFFQVLLTVEKWKKTVENDPKIKKLLTLTYTKY
jgi:UDP-4-amino-4,6-dideoxy-N-acetyl-beta-L-altrosamine N-acetyltransferase